MDAKPKPQTAAPGTTAGEQFAPLMFPLYPKLRSTEFWLSLAAIVVGALMGAGVFDNGSIYARIGGWVIAALGASGYTVSRSLMKGTAAQPGYRTSEFWKTVATSLLVWSQSHLFAPDSQLGELVGSLLAVLPAVTYGISRGALKASDISKLLPLAESTVQLKGRGRDDDADLIDEDPPQDGEERSK